MKLCIGLLAASPQWEQLLLQEGVAWQHADLPGDDLHSAFSALIINRALSKQEGEAVQGYLRRGGAILGYAGHLTGIGVRSRPALIEYLVGEPDSLFRLQILDGALEGRIAVEANMVRTQNNEFAVFAGDLGGGVAAIFPFDMDVLLADDRSIVKNFYAHHERLPAEHVSLASKGEIRHLVVQSLQYLHLARSIPYVHQWYFPDGARNVFAFRVDTDGGSREDIDRLYAIARSRDVGMTWFLDVQSHESWLHHFSSMVGQEMGVHCFEHKVFPDGPANLANLQKAKRLMETAGMVPAGMAMPYGSWTHEIGRTIEEMRLSYSSEFSFAYDTLPIHPMELNRIMNTLQIPIHPICIGSLRKVGYSEKMMHEYFTMKVNEKLARTEPLFFYHHPSDRNTGVVESLFDRMSEEQIPNITFSAYAQWWKLREATRPRFEIHGDQLAMVARENPSSIHVRVVMGGREAVVPTSSSLDLKKLSWRELPVWAGPPVDIRRIREFDTRALVAKLYTKFQRKFR